MIWSPIPIELILQDTTATRTVREQMLSDGGAVLVDMSGGPERVLRLDATDPQLYLLPEFTPGSVMPGGWQSQRPLRERPPGEA